MVHEYYVMNIPFTKHKTYFWVLCVCICAYVLQINWERRIEIQHLICTHQLFCQLIWLGERAIDFNHESFAYIYICIVIISISHLSMNIKLWHSRVNFSPFCKVYLSFCFYIGLCVSLHFWTSVSFYIFCFSLHL